MRLQLRLRPQENQPRVLAGWVQLDVAEFFVERHEAPALRLGELNEFPVDRTEQSELVDGDCVDAHRAVLGSYQLRQALVQEELIHGQASFWSAVQPTAQLRDCRICGNRAEPGIALASASAHYALWLKGSVRSRAISAA